MSVAIELREGLLPPLSTASPLLERTFFQKWRGRVVSSVFLTGALALRMANVTTQLNAISALAAGFSFQWLVEVVAHSENLSHVQQAALTVFSQATNFLLTSLWENTSDSNWQQFATTGSVFLLGANLAMLARYMIKEKQIALNVESDADAASKEVQTFKPALLANKYYRWLRSGLSGGCLVGAFFAKEDPVLLGVSFFGATYFVSEAIGAQVVRSIDKRISLQGRVAPSNLGELQGTNWRLVKKAVLTAGFICIPCAFIPWVSPEDSNTRNGQMVLAGAVVGFFEQAMYTSGENRLKRVPIEQLSEIKFRSEPKTAAARLAMKITQIWPFVVLAGINAFAIWQIGWDLDSRVSKFALGTFTGFLNASYGICAWVDRKWDAAKRTALMDQLFCGLLLTPRFFSISPISLYFVVENQIQMDDRHLDIDQNRGHTALIFFGYAACGAATAIELYRAAWKRRGTIFNAPTMLAISAKTVLVRMVKGELQ